MDHTARHKHSQQSSSLILFIYCFIFPAASGKRAASVTGDLTFTLKPTGL